MKLCGQLKYKVYFYLSLSRDFRFHSSTVQHNGTTLNGGSVSFVDMYHPPNISEIKRQIAKYNDMQLVINEYTFGPLQNDSVIIVVQVSKLNLNVCKYVMYIRKIK